LPNATINSFVTFHEITTLDLKGQSATFECGVAGGMGDKVG
jgi:hypothetical protein